MRGAPALLLLALAAGLAACGQAAARPGAGHGEIVVAAPHHGHLALFAVSPSGGARLIVADAGRDLYPAEDPSLAIAVEDAGEHHVEQLVRVEGGTLTPLGPAANRIRSPRLGRGFVVFEADVDSFRDLYRVELATSEVVRLTTSATGNFEPALAADGERIAFASSRDGDSEIYTMPARGGEARRITAFHRDDFAPSWSADGRLAFVSDREGADRVFIAGADGSDLLRVGLPGAEGGSDEDPVWSGTRLAFVHRDRDGEASSLWVVERGRPARRLSAAGARHDQPTWSPDGKQIAVRSAEGLTLFTLDGRARTLAAPAGAQLPRWR